MRRSNPRWQGWQISSCPTRTGRNELQRRSPSSEVILVSDDMFLAGDGVEILLEAGPGQPERNGEPRPQRRGEPGHAHPEEKLMPGQRVNRLLRMDPDFEGKFSVRRSIKRRWPSARSIWKRTTRYEQAGTELDETGDHLRRWGGPERTCTGSRDGVRLSSWNFSWRGSAVLGGDAGMKQCWQPAGQLRCSPRQN